ncbi:helix-turn-helix domain-containing protein [Nocardia yamanashiensis]|uniref:IclR family transcriptional regulator n=1 Tax=Nocardia yamanashiensis TaxID=209247 RepID=UPI001E4C82C7|nr:helix-turn-helix domain-containing protein [Nocardia yamanashiensis]UGT45521.1 helix-turn-helix domain-containing protein [Nocardia yamanashiensis]
MTEVLDAFAAGPDHRTLDEIAAHTDLPRSTVFRIIRQLVRLGWLDHDPPGYRLGPRVFGLAARQRDRSQLRAAAGPVLHTLHEHLGAVTHLGVLEGRHIRYLDKVGGPRAGVPSAVGQRTAATRTVLGWAVLAAMPPEHVDALFAVPAPDSDLLDVNRLHARLHRTRAAHGVAVSAPERCPMGIAGAAAPIIGADGGISGAISAAGRGLHPRRLAPLVADAARRIGERLTA